MSRIRVAVLSVVPSPYQRDLFAALARRPELDFHVFYLEASAPDSPWPERLLADYEKVLPGFWLRAGTVRWHVNRGLPDAGDFDLVIINNYMSTAAQKWMRSAKRRCRWVFWAERMRGSSWLHRLLTAPLHGADALVAIGTLAQADYACRFPAASIFNIPYHCDLQAFGDAPRPIRDADEITFLFCGQMIARKGVDVLLQAFDRVAREYPGVKLLLIGRPDAMNAEISKLPAATRSRISYQGFQAPEDLPQLFSQADVMVLPSRHDGWGVVVNQALGAGLALICSDAVGAAHDLIEDGVNGVTFRSGDGESLVAAMRRFAENPPLAVAWGAASRRKAGDWTPDAGAAKWVEVIRATVSA